MLNNIERILLCLSSPGLIVVGDAFFVVVAGAAVFGAAVTENT